MLQDEETVADRQMPLEALADRRGLPAHTCPKAQLQAGGRHSCRDASSITPFPFLLCVTNFCCVVCSYAINQAISKMKVGYTPYVSQPLTLTWSYARPCKTTLNLQQFWHEDKGLSRNGGNGDIEEEKKLDWLGKTDGNQDFNTQRCKSQRKTCTRVCSNSGKKLWE